MRTGRATSGCFKPLGVGVGVRTDEFEVLTVYSGRVSNPSEWGSVRAPVADPRERRGCARFKPLGVGVGARTNPRAFQRAEEYVVSNPSEWGSVRAPGGEGHTGRRGSRFQTPRSGGRCAHRSNDSASMCGAESFKPLGVGVGARTACRSEVLEVDLRVSNPSEWGSVRAPPDGFQPQ